MRITIGNSISGRTAPWVNRADMRAFTLVEIMVAIGLLGLVMVAIYSSWTAIVRGAKAGQDAAAEAQRARIAIGVVEDSLLTARLFAGNAAWYSFEVDTSDPNFAAMSFVSHLPQSFPRSGRFGDLVVRRVIFTVEPGPDGGNELVMRQVPLMMEPDIDEENFPVVLAQDVSKFLVDFWDEQEEDWIPEWLTTNQLPKMVRVTIGLGSGTGYSSQPRHVMSRVVGIPAVPVQPGWQVPGGTAQRPTGIQPIPRGENPAGRQNPPGGPIPNPRGPQGGAPK